MKTVLNGKLGAVLGATALAAVFAMAEPAKSAGPAANKNTTSTKVDLGSIAVATTEQASALSSQPIKRVVFHYSASMPKVCQYMVVRQAEILRTEGYHVIAVSGASHDGVRLYVAGKTNDKLLFSCDQIIEQLPRGYGAGLYEKYIGQPETHPVDVASVSPGLQ